MEVMEPCTALVSNLEVLVAFRADKARREESDRAVGRAKRRAGSQTGSGNAPAAEEGDEQIRTLEYEVLSYLEKTPCAAMDPAAIERFLAASATWGLTKAEKLMIINHVPRNAVELYALIEEPAARFGPGDDELMERLDAMVTQVQTLCGAS